MAKKNSDNQLECDLGEKKDFDESLQSLMQKAKELDDRSSWYFSRYEKWKFLKMIPLMQQFAYEEGAKIKVKMLKTEGRFILTSPKYCFCDIVKLDRIVLKYMKGRVVLVSADEGMARIEIIAVFRKRRRLLC